MSDTVKYYTTRIRKEYLYICGYLEARAEALANDTLHEEIFRFGIEYIDKNGFNYNVIKFTRSHPKNFYISITTQEQCLHMAEYFHTLNQNVYRYHIIEFYIYIYTIYHLSDMEKQVLKDEFMIDIFEKKFT